MKRATVFSAIMLLVSSIGFADPTPVSSVWENFMRPAGVNWDTNAADNEVIQRLDGTNGTGFAWGGFVPETAVGGAIFVNANNRICWGIGGGAAQSAFTAGGRVYTRFDTVSETTGSCNTPSIVVDASSPVHGCLLRFFNPGVAGTLEFALLIRSDNKWYQSSAITWAYPYTTVAFSTLTWQECDPASPGVIDMDEVDPQGEGEIALLPGAATPNLSAIDGMGVIIVNTPANTATAQLENLLIGSVVDGLAAPDNLEAIGSEGKITLSWDASGGATGYSVYRSLTSGGEYTLLNDTPTTESIFEDNTVDADTTYYYVVRAHGAIATAFASKTVLTTQDIESEDSTEVSAAATDGPVSSVTGWEQF